MDLGIIWDLIFSVGLIQRDHKINIYDQRVTYAFLTMWYVRMLIESEVRILTWINTWAKNSSFTYFHVTCGQFGLCFQEGKVPGMADNGGGL